VWDLRHVGTGNLAPINAAPAPDGNIHVDLEAQTYRLVGRDFRPGHETTDRYLNHFATCPAAAAWRARRKLPAK
jgi:glucose dehydrogenase